MLGYKGHDQLELFITDSLRQLVPEDHVLARADRVLDLGWLCEEVADCYYADNGRPGPSAWRSPPPSPAAASITAPWRA